MKAKILKPHSGIDLLGIMIMIGKDDIKIERNPQELVMMGNIDGKKAVEDHMMIRIKRIKTKIEVAVEVTKMIEDPVVVKGEMTIADLKKRIVKRRGVVTVGGTEEGVTGVGAEVEVGEGEETGAGVEVEAAV